MRCVNLRGRGHAAFIWHAENGVRSLQDDLINESIYSYDLLDLTTELCAHGASEFIAKPCSNKGRTLASVIYEVLDSQTT